MAKKSSTVLFKEDWSRFAAGPIYRDNTARGEYMAMVVPENPGGWYHNASAGKSIDRDHSPFAVKQNRTGRVLDVPASIRPWGPQCILTPGPQPWADYTVLAEITVKGPRSVGLVARYRTNRDYYAALFESGMFKLVRVLEGTMTVLDSIPLKPTRKPIHVALRVDGTNLQAQADNLKLSAQDGCIDSGGIGLWANGPASFGKVVVMAPAAEIRRQNLLHRQQKQTLLAKRRNYPEMELVAEIDVAGHALGRQIRFADLDGDGRQEILFAIPTYHKGRNWTYNKLARISALNLDGQVLWERGKIQPDSTDITADLPFQAADRGNGIEVVAAFGPSLEILDPMTGKTKKKALTPVPPKMEPYWDEINMYWGDGHGDDLPRLIPDSIRLCNFTGRHPYGDMLIKDRYHNAWAIDGRSLKVLWHHRCNTGHYPFTVDLNGDGKDEVLLGYSRVDSKGRFLGRLYLGDHPDACFSYVDNHGVRHNLHPCGEAGFIDEFSDGRMEEVHLGHVQHLSIANFCQDRPDLERIIVTYHGNQGIIVLMDADDRIIRKVERYAAGAICQPVNWTGDGRELIAFSPRHSDGGLWDEHFDLVVPFPNNDRPGKYMEVHDVLGLGIDQVIVWDEHKMHVYAPRIRPKRKGKRYHPVRPEPNLSNYQVNYSLPRWV